jgi:hypothetical protein
VTSHRVLIFIVHSHTRPHKWPMRTFFGFLKTTHSKFGTTISENTCSLNVSNNFCSVFSTSLTLKFGQNVLFLSEKQPLHLPNLWTLNFDPTAKDWKKIREWWINMTISKFENTGEPVLGTALKSPTKMLMPEHEVPNKIKLCKSYTCTSVSFEPNVVVN